jgi:hypothetical protein
VVVTLESNASPINSLVDVDAEAEAEAEAKAEAKVAVFEMPLLVSVLHGEFIVDVKLGSPLILTLILAFNTEFKVEVESLLRLFWDILASNTSDAVATDTGSTRSLCCNVARA